MLYIAIIYIVVLFISPFLYLLLIFGFPSSNLFTAQKIRNNTVEAPYVIPGVSSETENYLRVEPIVESEIGFLLEI